MLQCNVLILKFSQNKPFFLQFLLQIEPKMNSSFLFCLFLPHWVCFLTPSLSSSSRLSKGYKSWTAFAYIVPLFRCPTRSFWIIYMIHPLVFEQRDSALICTCSDLALKLIFYALLVTVEFTDWNDFELEFWSIELVFELSLMSVHCDCLPDICFFFLIKFPV